MIRGKMFRQSVIHGETTLKIVTTPTVQSRSASSKQGQNVIHLNSGSNVYFKEGKPWAVMAKSDSLLGYKDE